MMADKSSVPFENIIVERVSKLEGSYDSVERELSRLRDEINSLYRTLHALKTDLLTNDVKSRSELMERIEATKGELMARMEMLSNNMLVRDDKLREDFMNELNKLNLELNTIWNEIKTLENFIRLRERKLLMWITLLFVIFLALQIAFNLSIR